MFTCGAVGASVYQQADISQVMVLQGLILPAVIVLGLNIWTTNDSALYASGLAFSNITGLSKKKLVIFNGVLGSLFSMFLYHHFVGFLTLLGSCLPPIGAIIISDYALRRRQMHTDGNKFDIEVQGVRLSACLAWAGGSIAAHWLPGIAPINGLLVAALIYLLMERS